MSFWSSNKFKENGKDLVINGFDENNISSACYDLTLGDEVFISPLPNSTMQERKTLRLSEENPSEIVPAGQFAYLITAEELQIPKDCIGFISFKFKTKALGLVNVSGFHVDPGYRGRLIFAMYNASGFNHKLTRGEKIFSIWISQLDQKDAAIKGKPGFQHLTDMQNGILNINDPVSSLPLLSKQIKEIENKQNNQSLKFGIALGLLIPIDIALLQYLIDSELGLKGLFEFFTTSSLSIIIFIVLTVVILLLSSVTMNKLRNYISIFRVFLSDIYDKSVTQKNKNTKDIQELKELLKSKDLID